MNAKTSVYEKPGRLRPIHGVMCLLLCAAVAELVFASVIAPPHVIVRIGRLALAFLVIYTIHRYAVYGLHSYRPSLRELSTMSLVIIGSLFLVWIGRFIALGMLTSAQDVAFIPDISEESIHYIIPLRCWCAYYSSYSWSALWTYLWTGIFFSSWHIHT